jgi:hypothetical protein
LRQDYITLHWLKAPETYNAEFLAYLQTLQIGAVDPGFALALFSSLAQAGGNVDAFFRGEGGSLPSTVILDYVYGVAAYKSWHSQRGDGLDVVNQYREKHYAQIPRAPSDYTRMRRGESDLSKAMDRLSMHLMYIHGITPEVAAERRQKKIEQEERAAQEASRSKVMEWRNHLDIH